MKVYDVNTKWARLLVWLGLVVELDVVCLPKIPQSVIDGWNRTCNIKVQKTKPKKWYF